GFERILVAGVHNPTQLGADHPARRDGGLGFGFFGGVVGIGVGVFVRFVALRFFIVGGRGLFFLGLVARIGDEAGAEGHDDARSAAREPVDFVEIVGRENP